MDNPDFLTVDAQKIATNIFSIFVRTFFGGIGKPSIQEWHPHRMKAGLRNHPIGRKTSIISRILFGYTGEVSQLENSRKIRAMTNRGQSPAPNDPVCQSREERNRLSLKG
jgi:hypothetical protein